MSNLGTKLSSYVAAISVDGISIALGSPPTAIFGQTLSDGFSRYLRSRSDSARDILIGELKTGNKLSCDVDPETFYGLLFQYLNAVKIGAAKRNLRLIAQIIREGSTSTIPFLPDELASCAKIVSDLTSEEIILLAELKNQHSKFIDVTVEKENPRILIHNATLAALVPKQFQTKEDFFAIASALQRTGLIRMPSVWGGNRVDTTKKFDVICRLCDLETFE